MPGARDNADVVNNEAEEIVFIISIAVFFCCVFGGLLYLLFLLVALFKAFLFDDDHESECEN